MISVFRKRIGFTLLEVLGAAVVLTIALLGISAAAAGLLKKAKAPNKVETATQLANERLAYFRAQPDPFRAVGGTHYPPPARRGDTDWARVPEANNQFNCNVAGDDNTNFPTLFVREYLFGDDEGQGVVDANGRDLARTNQMRDFVNIVPDLPNDQPYARVYPNVDGAGAVDALPAGFPGDFGVFQVAPRANNGITVASGQALRGDVAYVREVWVQTNHPEFGPSGVTANALLVEPRVVRYLPPYTVAVTVKVFARIPQVTRLANNLPVTNAATGIQTGAASLAYDPTKPLAEVVGFFGLRRLR